MFLIDTNQASQEKRKDFTTLLDLLEEKETVMESTLYVGDLSFVGRDEKGKLSISFGVEIKKSPSDLMASVRDGRYVDQLIRMVQEYDFAYLLLIGENIRANFKTGFVQERGRKKERGKWVDSPFRYHYVRSILSRFEGSGGRVSYAQDDNHAAAFLLSLHDYWQKPDHSEEMFVRKRHKLLDWRMLDNQLAEIYERMEVGIKKALRLAEEYPTMLDLALASEKELRQLPGFGKGTVSKVVRYARGEGRKIV